MIIARFCIELRAETEDDVRQQQSTVRRALVQLDRDRGYRMAVTSPELSRDDATSFKAGTYLRPAVTTAPRGQTPPSHIYWRMRTDNLDQLHAELDTAHDEIAELQKKLSDLSGD